MILELESPPESIVDLAIGIARLSPCQDKRGAVIYVMSRTLPSVALTIAEAFNFRPAPTCDGSDRCRSRCKLEAVHAEQGALLAAGVDGKGADLVHVQISGGELVASGPPSCVECSKLALAAEIDRVWLYHAHGWQAYAALFFHEQSIRNRRIGA